ncbi:MAG: DNA phosphorothioation-associated protein 4 [Sphaerospermopsis sp. SIO1G2]|nr:DNA phosphorothioation-associated protein 4 [Sphaerospermopsis sp. SIO1G1]NET69560.1 DNA phosphorothioation-associated protein 4 [Sphaerospermopsis sp. SIO1G2]
MSESGRIRVAKDKADFVKALISDDGGNGPFQTFADVIVFAAALGAKYNKRVSVDEVSKREPTPIRLEIFAASGYDIVIKLLGITETQDIQILSPDDEDWQKKCNGIFEEYANGGLEILQGELRGSIDYTNTILLFLQHEKLNHKSEDEEFDLTRFLS